MTFLPATRPWMNRVAGVLSVLAAAAWVARWEGWQDVALAVVFLVNGVIQGIVLPRQLARQRLVVDDDGVQFVHPARTRSARWSQVTRVLLPEGLRVVAQVQQADGPVVPVSSQFRSRDGRSPTELVVAAARERGIAVEGEHLRDRRWVIGVALAAVLAVSVAIALLFARLL